MVMWNKRPDVNSVDLLFVLAVVIIVFLIIFGIVRGF